MVEGKQYCNEPKQRIYMQDDTAVIILPFLWTKEESGIAALTYYERDI
jgi:hypothetical protein